MRYLLVEDSLDVGGSIARFFLDKGHAIDVATTLQIAQDYLGVQEYDAVILDLNMPDGNGMDLLRDLRQAAQSLPVLILSVNHAIETRLRGFDVGADDYMFKPFDLRELDARLRSLIRKRADEKGKTIHFGDTEIDFTERRVRFKGDTVHLAPKEFSLLEVLSMNINRPVSKSILQDKLYSFQDAEVSPNAVELRIARLRKKLAVTGIGIKALWGIGYQLDWGD